MGTPLLGDLCASLENPFNSGCAETPCPSSTQWGEVQGLCTARALTFQMNSSHPGKKNCLVQTTVFPCLSLPGAVFDTPAETVPSAKRKEVVDFVLLFPFVNGLCFHCVGFSQQKHTQRRKSSKIPHSME